MARCGTRSSLRPLAGVGRLTEARLAPPFYRRGLTLTPSEATRDELLGLGFRGDRVVAVNNGVDPKFRPGGNRSPVPLVVCVGRLAPVKRQDELIEAAVVARRRVPDLRLMIIGDGPMRADLQAQITAARGGGVDHPRRSPQPRRAPGHLPVGLAGEPAPRWPRDGV